MLVTDPSALEAILRRARRIAVLGIKPESRSTHDAHDIPRYLASVGYEIVPVPTRYPEAEVILGARVRRSLAEVDGAIDVLSVWVKREELAAYVSQIVRMRPGCVWVQSALLDPEVERALVDAGLTVVEECIGCRRASIEPAWERLS
jgi:predicted CoA-binding protein